MHVQHIGQHSARRTPDPARNLACVACALIFRWLDAETMLVLPPVFDHEVHAVPPHRGAMQTRRP